MSNKDVNSDMLEEEKKSQLYSLRNNNDGITEGNQQKNINSCEGEALNDDTLIVEYKVEIEVLKTNLVNMDKECKTLKEENQTLKEENLRLDEKIKKMKENVIQLKEKFDLDLKKRKLDSLGLDNVKQESNDDKDRQIEELTQVVSKVKSFEDGIRILKMNNKQLLKEKTELEEVVIKQEEKIRDFQAKSTKADEQLKVKIKELLLSEQNGASLVKLIEDQKKKISTLSSQISEFGHKDDKLKLILKEKESEIYSLKNFLKTFQGELASSKLTRVNSKSNVEANQIQSYLKHNINSLSVSKGNAAIEGKLKLPKIRDDKSPIPTKTKASADVNAKKKKIPTSQVHNNSNVVDRKLKSQTNDRQIIKEKLDYDKINIDIKLKSGYYGLNIPYEEKINIKNQNNLTNININNLSSIEKDNDHGQSYFDSPKHNIKATDKISSKKQNQTNESHIRSVEKNRLNYMSNDLNESNDENFKEIKIMMRSVLNY